MPAGASLVPGRDRARVREVRTAKGPRISTHCAACHRGVTFTKLPPWPWHCPACQERYGVWGDGQGPQSFTLQGKTYWRVPCVACGLSLFFDFRPERAKCCAACQAPYEAGESACRALRRARESESQGCICAIRPHLPRDED